MYSAIDVYCAGYWPSDAASWSDRLSDGDDRDVQIPRGIDRDGRQRLALAEIDAALAQAP